MYRRRSWPSWPASADKPTRTLTTTELNIKVDLIFPSWTTYRSPGQHVDGGSLADVFVGSNATRWLRFQAEKPVTARESLSDNRPGITWEKILAND